MTRLRESRSALVLALSGWASILTAGCGGDSDNHQATPDVPRYSEAQAISAIRSHTYTCTRAIGGCGLGVQNGDTASASCRSDRLQYEGNGIWNCQTWSLDELTGVVFRNPRATPDAD